MCLFFGQPDRVTRFLDTVLRVSKIYFHENESGCFNAIRREMSVSFVRDSENNSLSDYVFIRTTVVLFYEGHAHAFVISKVLGKNFEFSTFQRFPAKMRKGNMHK